jgi:crossover junction endodeoxyribonuclease RuvC
MRLLGIDPGLRRTGWGVIEAEGNRLSFVDAGTVSSKTADSLAQRLAQLHDGILEIVERFRPDEVAVEETYVNMNPRSTLALGQARGIALLVPAKQGIPVAEYPPNLIKKSVVGTGHAAKEQIQLMVRTLLPGSNIESPDAADALAIAICHAHHATSLAYQAAVKEAAE